MGSGGCNELPISVLPRLPCAAATAGRPAGPDQKTAHREKHKKQALDDKSFQEGRRITLNEVSEATGISRPTLTRISNVPGYNTWTSEVVRGDLVARLAGRWRMTLALRSS